MRLLVVAAALAAALFVNIGLAQWPASTAGAGYLDSFASQAAWEQVAGPHPAGLDCWVLADGSRGQNSPQLLWCERPAPGRGSNRIDREDRHEHR